MSGGKDIYNQRLARVKENHELLRQWETPKNRLVVDQTALAGETK